MPKLADLFLIPYEKMEKFLGYSNKKDVCGKEIINVSSSKVHI